MAKRGRPPLYGKSLEEIFHETGASRSAYRRHRKLGRSHEDALALAMGADVPSVPEPDTGAWGPAG